MSALASIDITFEEPTAPCLIVSALLKHGWTLNDNGHISYLQLGDIDYDWTWCENSDIDSVLNVIKEKHLLDETIGISIMWANTNIGGELLIWGGEGALSLNLSSNRRQLNNPGSVDYLWYLEKLINAFYSHNIYPSSIKCSKS